MISSHRLERMLFNNLTWPMSKRLLMLGGSKLQVPAIQQARQQGCYVIICDYLPGNPGRSIADEYHNVSTTDREAVLRLAQTLRIDGIVAYASDPAAPTAAYVANALGLPGNPYQSVLTLTRKDLYREFLAANGFNTPRFRTVTTAAEARIAGCGLIWPVVIKPVDSSGSRGVTIVEEQDSVEAACATALAFARHKAIVIEEYVDTEYRQLQFEGDGFVCDGRLVFRAFCDGNFDRLGSPVVPIGVTFPSVYGREIQERAHSEIQRLVSLLGIERGALNFDIRVDRQGQIFLMEIGPRNGGNMLPQVIQRSTGVDLIDYTLRSALGLDCSDLKTAEVNGFHASYVLHAIEDGVFEGISFSDTIQARIVSRDIWVKPGQSVSRFDGSHKALGTLTLEFATFENMRHAIENMEQHVRVNLQ